MTVYDRSPNLPAKRPEFYRDALDSLAVRSRAILYVDPAKRLVGIDLDGAFHTVRAAPRSAPGRDWEAHYLARMVDDPAPEPLPPYPAWAQEELRTLSRALRDLHDRVEREWAALPSAAPAATEGTDNA